MATEEKKNIRFPPSTEIENGIGFQVRAAIQKDLTHSSNASAPNTD